MGHVIRLSDISKTRDRLKNIKGGNFDRRLKPNPEIEHALIMRRIEQIAYNLGINLDGPLPPRAQ